MAEDGFTFQHDCIARLAIEMLYGDEVVEIVCETHEDVLVLFADGSAELVSCKARDPGKPYSLESLISDGGVRHLFESWLYLGGFCRTRLMAEAALSARADVRGFMAACESRDATRIAPWAKRLASTLATDVPTAHRFCAGLRMTGPSTIGPRAKAGDINATNLRRWLRDSNLAETLDTTCYSLLRDRIALCCRAAVADRLSSGSLLDASREPAKSAERERIENRTLDRGSTVAAMVDVFAGHALLTGDPDSLDHSRLTVKLERGKVPQPTVALARRLRASWFEYEAALAVRAPGTDPHLTDLRVRSLLIVADALAEIDIREPYGQRMYAALRNRLKVALLLLPWVR